MSARVFRSPFPTFLVGMMLLFAGFAAAQDDGPDGPDFVPSEGDDWLEYYRKPTPDRFVGQLKNWSADGTLTDEHARPPLIAFLSQVIRQNRDKIAQWYADLKGLSPEDLQVLHTAMLFSRTSEAEDVLKKEYGDKFTDQKQEMPKILEMKLDRRDSLDMLWGFFYATGDKAAIRRIVNIFIFVDFPDRPDFAKVPDDYKPLYTEMPNAAHWSLVSNAQRHPKVRELLEEIYRDKAEESKLSPTEKRRLRNVLNEIDPEKWPLGVE